MHVIRARNVAQALPAGLAHLLAHGRWEDTRAGRALVAPWPVATVYEHPRERVLHSAARDANPFFHLAEALWMLAGRRDAAFLDHFVRDFGARFAEPDGTVHGAYGHRWRSAFGFDQLNAVVQMLSSHPESRQAVIAMWDPTYAAARDVDWKVHGGREVRVEDAGEDDLQGTWRDRPCNTHAYLRVQSTEEPVLDVTVCCRSNDAVWGAYGANAVHFSALQEYLAARLDVGVGTYTQVSNNFHAYADELDRLGRRAGAPPGHSGFSAALLDDRYSSGAVTPVPLVHDADAFDGDLLRFLQAFERGVSGDAPPPLHNKFLLQTAWPALVAHRNRERGWEPWAQRIAASDWRVSCTEWLERRARRRDAA